MRGSTHGERQSEEVVEDGAAAPYGRWERTLVATMGVPVFPANRIDVLKNGIEIFPAMLDAIRQAERAVDFLTFVYWTGDVAREFADALCQAARRGVSVRVLLDGVGAYPMDRDLLDSMTSSGVDARWFRPVSRWDAFWKLTHRTHRKVLICDGAVAFTGGVGIGAEWEGNATDPSEWRETHFRIRGPAVQGLQGAFLGNWLECAPKSAVDFAGSPGELEDEGESDVLVVRSSASLKWSDLSTLVRTLFGLARESVLISTPYLVPDDWAIELLESAARRGVDVTVLVPGPHMDHRVAQVAAEAYYQDLLEAGIEIWEYLPTMIHQKIIVIDDEVAAIGSGNLNQRSLLQDDEIQMVVLDASFAKSLAQMVHDDRSDARPVDLARWGRRGPLRRLVESSVHLLRRQM